MKTCWLSSYYEKFANGTIKCIDDEIPFEIPKGWEWARLIDVCSYIQRGKSPIYSETKQYPVIAQKCNQWSGFSIEKAQFIAPETVPKYSEERILQDKDLLWNSTGLGTLGRMAVYLADKNPYGWAVADSHVTVIRPINGMAESYFLYTYFASPTVQSVIEDKAEGSTKQKELYVDTVKGYLIPVPPYNEQQRIVSKIEEVLPVVFKYGKSQDKLDVLNSTINDNLRKSILQEAIQGKLVPQDPKDEPAAILLDRINLEKQNLLKQGKLKKKDVVDTIIFKGEDNKYYENINGKVLEITEEIPFDAPDGWSWCRLGSLLSVVSDGTHKTPSYVDKGVPFLSVQNISSGVLDTTKVKYISSKEHKSLCARISPQKGDILLCRIGTLGKALKVYWDFDFSIFVSLGLLRPVLPEIADYIVLYINSPFGYQWIQKIKVGGGTHTYKINLSDIPNMPICLPPLNEQYRISEMLKRVIASTMRM